MLDRQNAEFPQLEIRHEKPARTPEKLNIIIERRIENLWLEADSLNWSYQQFVSLILESISVIRYRNRLLDRTLPPKQGYRIDY